MKKSRSEVTKRMLRIGIPSKGRLSEVVADLLHDAGLSFRRISRSLFARCRDVPVEIVFLRTDDIPILTAEGAIGHCEQNRCNVTSWDSIFLSDAQSEHQLPSSLREKLQPCFFCGFRVRLHPTGIT